MTAYIIRRLLLIIPTIILVTIIIFFTIRLIPGSILDLMIAQQSTAGGNPIDIDKLAAMLGLDVPIHVQYAQWVANAVQGDLGRSPF